MDKEILKELDKVTYLTDKNDRTGETFATALINRLKETRDKGNVGYARDIVISLPKSAIDTSEDAVFFLQKSGEISRDESLGLPVELEYTKAKDINGNAIIIVDIVFKYTEATDVEAVAKFLNS